MFSGRETDSSGMGVPDATVVFAESPTWGGAVRMGDGEELGRDGEMRGGVGTVEERSREMKGEGRQWK